MYPYVLFLHSWLRWLVVAIAVVVAVRAALRAARDQPWSRADDTFRRAFLGIVDLQLAIGLTLYLGLSPMVRAALQDLGAAMRSTPLRFFAIEHVTAMLAAVTVAHVVSERVARAATSRARHRRMVGASLGFLALVGVGMPWPGLKQGRPLFRTWSSATASLRSARDGATPEVYRQRCAVCHGAAGHGDGPASPAMRPGPRDFRDSAWQSTISDAALREVIARGGAARGLSTNMPAHPDLSEAQLGALLRFIRASAGSAAR